MKNKFFTPKFCATLTKQACAKLLCAASEDANSARMGIKMLENIWIIILFSIILASWGYVLMRAFVCLILAPNPLRFVSTLFAVSLQTVLQVFFFIGTFHVPPTITIMVAILTNMLVSRTIVKAKVYYLLLVSVIYSVSVLSVDMFVVLGLTLLSRGQGIDEIFVTIVGFLILVIILAPLVFFGLRKISFLEPEQITRMLRRVQVIVTLFCLSAGMLGQYYIAYIPHYSWARGVDLWFFPLVMMFLAFSMLAGSDFLHIRQVDRLKEAEHQALQQYIKDIERQSREIQQFKHDYKNILLSLDSYIYQGDLQRLKEFFEDKIKNTSESLLCMDTIQGEHYLRNIQIDEIKSILLIKMQEMVYKNIQVEFEAIDCIEEIAIDTIMMVRILGILLDNAIEEVIALENKKISIGVIKNEEDVIFVVTNTCREGLKCTKEVEKKGFSLKGEGRGIGLYNLAGFVAKHDNLFTETKIENNYFVQIITIEGE